MSFIDRLKIRYADHVSSDVNIPIPNKQDVSAPPRTGIASTDQFETAAVVPSFLNEQKQRMTAPVPQYDLDSMSEMGEMESLRLQMAMDRMSKIMSTLSNLLKKSSDSSQTITQNLK